METPQLRNKVHNGAVGVGAEGNDKWELKTQSISEERRDQRRTAALTNTHKFKINPFTDN